ncbi:MAG: hypothetical protein ACLFNQ_05895 [Spirochaetaceae bacterium]
MKLRFFLMFCLLLGVSTAFGQERVVQNDTDGTLVYLVITPDRYATLTEAADPEVFSDLFSRFSDRLDRVPPRGVRLLERMPDTDRVLIGYIDDPSRTDGPLVASEVPADDDGALIRIDAESRLQANDSVLTLRSWQFIADPAPIHINNRYSQWVSVPDLAAFRADFRPEVFSRFTDRAQRDLTLSDSLLWGRGGSRLERVKALRWEESVFIMAASVSEMSNTMSILVRLYPDRSTFNANEYTLEIPLSDVGGPVLLWSDRTAEPRIVGDFVRTRFFVEAELKTDRFPDELARLVDGGTSFDISTRLSDHGLLEEFHHTTGFVRDIPGFHGSVSR